MSTAKKDNSTFLLKVSLRHNVLKEIENPIVMETHGGYGHIGARCYFGLPEGVVFEKDAAKSAALAQQRPAWAVYECDCIAAIHAGVGAHLPVNFLDLDPYGEPWPVLDAFFGSERRFPRRLAIAVNDGLRLKLKTGTAWATHSLQEAVQRFGNAAIYPRYLDVCRWLLAKKAGQRGYSLTRWAGYYCGHAEQMTHYAAVLERD